MTIGNTSPARASFNCDGVTKVFPVAIQAYQASDITVVHTTSTGVESTLTLNSDYSMVATGTLSPPAQTMTTLSATAFPSGDTLQAFINPVQQQQTQYVQGQAFPSFAIQTNVDRLTQMVQRLQDQLSRSVRAPDGDISPGMLFPSTPNRLSQYVATDGSGNLITTAALPGTANTAASLGPILNPQTAAEISAGVTPVNFLYAPGNVLRYGTNTTPGTTDMTVAFQAALNAYAGQHVFVPTGIYKITSSLVVQNNTWLYGTGAQSQIIQSTNNIPILYVQGERTKVSDLYLAYVTLQTGSNTWGNGIHCGGPLNTSLNFYESILERLYIFNANCGIYCGNKAISGDTNQSNFIYSCTIRDIRIANYGWQGMYLGVDGGQGNSGNVVENIYIINSNTNTTANGVSLVSWGDGVIDQLNIEHAKHTGPSLVLNNCDNLTINGLHFEGITVPLGSDFIGLIDVAGSRVSITGLSVDLNFFNPATFYALIRLGGSGNTLPAIVLSNVIERGNTFGGSPTKPVFYFLSNNPTARLFSYTLNAFSGSSGTGNLLQNENVFNGISAQGPLSLGSINTTAAGTYTVAATDTVVIFGATCSVTMPTASASANRILLFKSPGAFAVSSASANVVPLAGGAAGTAILSAAGSKFAYLQSDGSNWNVLMAN